MVVANCLNMLVRIRYCSVFISRAVHAEWPESAAPHPRAMPHSRVVAALCAAAVATNLAKVWLGRPHCTVAQHAAHVAFGLCCLAVVGLSVLREEPELIAAFRAARHRRRKED